MQPGPVRAIPVGNKIIRARRARDVYCIEYGLIKLINVSQDGTELIVRLCSPGWIVGTVGAIIRHPNLITAVTLTECCLRRVPAERLLHFVKNDSHFSWHMHQLHSLGIYDQLLQLVRLRTLSAQQRLEQLFLQMLSALETNDSRRGIRLQLPLKHLEIAQLISVTPQHLSRMLKQMEHEAKIRRDKGWIIISDPQKLWCQADVE